MNPNGLLTEDIVGSNLVHEVKGFPHPTWGKVISVERSSSGLTIFHTHRGTDIETTTRHPKELEMERDKKTGEIQIRSRDGITTIRPH